ncbi:MAG: ribonuclease P protein component [Bacteroidota bacterium]
MSPKAFGLKKNERLTHKKTIARLFEEGKSVKQYPFRLIAVPISEKTNQIAFAVPKRNIKLAVDRNRMKRLMREVYRQEKHILSKNKEPFFAIMIVYQGRKSTNFQEVAKKIPLLLHKFVQQNKTDEEQP